MDPDIDASGLRISCAMPAAISPTAASRCCNRASRSSFFTSVRSWNVIRKPARPVRRVHVRRAQADVDSRLIGAAELELEAARAGATEAAPERVGHLGGQLQDVGNGAADSGRCRHAADALGRLVEREHALRTDRS